MTRNAWAHLGSYVVIIAGLLVPAVSYAASDQPGANPARSTCDSKAGCATDAMGDTTKAKPARRGSHMSRAQENRITAELNRQQLTGENSQQTMTPPPASR